MSLKVYSFNVIIFMIRVEECQITGVNDVKHIFLLLSITVKKFVTSGYDLTYTFDHNFGKKFNYQIVLDFLL
jgi:hypothetical protein